MLTNTPSSFKLQATSCKYEEFQTTNCLAKVKALPDDERFGLSSQIRRAAVSISSNIAEGSSRKSDKDYVRFLEMALGSSFELETQLLLIKELGLMNEIKLSESFGLLEEVQKMLQALISSILKSAKTAHQLEA